MDEARRNDIRKDKLDAIVEKMESRIKQNRILEDEINERQKGKSLKRAFRHLYIYSTSSVLKRN